MLWRIVAILATILIIILVVRLVIGFTSMILSMRVGTLLLIIALIALGVYALRRLGLF